MFKGLIKRLTGPSVQPEDLTRPEAVSILDRASNEARAKLAGATDDGEVLAYLSEDEKPEIRALVAANPATPRAIDVSLADDSADEVRLELAQKISRLLPDLAPGQAKQLREATIAVLERLSKDHLPRVRQILAEEIKASDAVPKTVALTLAHDVEQEVAAPIVEYSPLLNDHDLLEVIATSQADGVLTAVARRKGLSQDVSDAVVASLDIPAIAALLTNPDAAIRQEALDQVADHAEEVSFWHEGLVLRPDLSVRAIRRISGFVASSLLIRLADRHAIDDDLRRELQLKVKDRLAEERGCDDEVDVREDAQNKVRAAAEGGLLDDDFIAGAIEVQDRLLVVLSICVLARLPEDLVERILKSRNGVLVTALCWHAGLGMRTAFAVQKDFLKLSGAELLPARNGTDYPLAEKEMEKKLSLLGVAPRA